jgi:hypothetical protein
MDCSAPTDHYIVRTANIISPLGFDNGDVQLWYSPACRSVLSVAVLHGTPCVGGWSLKAYVIHNGTVTGSGVCAPGGRKAYTPWVDDAGIQQSGKGALFLNGDLFSSGMTGAY